MSFRDGNGRSRRIAVGVIVGLGLAAVGAVAVGADGQDEAPDSATVQRSQTGQALGPPCRMDTGVDRSTREEPSAGLLAVLGVLRTAAVDEDRFPAAESVRGTPGVQLEATRYLGTAPSGNRYYVVPLRNGRVAEEPLPQRCVQALRGEARERAERRNRRVRDARPAWDICLLSETGSGGCGMGGATVLEERGTIGSSQAGGPTSDVVGLVPDGVASVTARYDGFERTVPVARNFFAYGVELDASRALRAQILWRDQAGDVIREIPPG